MIQGIDKALEHRQILSSLARTELVGNRQLRDNHACSCQCLSRVTRTGPAVDQELRGIPIVSLDQEWVSLARHVIKGNVEASLVLRTIQCAPHEFLDTIKL